ncbi:MAG: hypothetical protein ABW150_17055 [Candidatus Thiodiazotropha sp.]
MRARLLRTSIHNDLLLDFHITNDLYLVIKAHLSGIVGETPNKSELPQQ